MIELNKFYIANSVDFMQQNIDNDFVDLVITSPPYDNLRDYNGFIFDYQSMFTELYRVIKPGGIIVWVVGDQTIAGSESCTSFKHAIYARENVGFRLHDTMIYQKCGNLPTKNRYVQSFEYMFVFSKGKPKTVNLIMDKENKWGGQSTFGKSSFRNKDGSLSEGKKRTVREMGIRENIWRYANGYGFGQKDDIAYKHPATFPEEMAKDHLLSWSNLNDIILDPMCGSGTVCKMAWLNQRKFIGIDISDEYINNICIPRLEKYGWNNK